MYWLQETVLKSELAMVNICCG